MAYYAVFSYPFIPLVLVFHPRLAREILVKGMALLEKLHFLHHKEARIEKLNASMDQYRDTAVFLKEHKQVIVNVFEIGRAHV